MTHHITRRGFLSNIAVGVAFSAMGCTTASVKANKPFSWSSTLETYRDEKTGALVRRLTNGRSRDEVVYQTHPMWVKGMDYLVFNSDRSGQGMQPHILESRTGTIRPLTDQPVADYVVARKSAALYALTGDAILAFDAERAFHEGAPPKWVFDWPRDHAGHIGMMSLDATERILYAGFSYTRDKEFGVLAIDLPTGKSRPVAVVDFQVGHVQANPEIPGVVSFCWETGGDAPQRMWLVDANDGNARPFYKETYEEWVTHEAWWGPDRMLFTIWPYDDAHKTQPHGVAVVEYPSGDHRIIYQMPAWHTAGSPDGRRVMADDFDRNLWLIDPNTGERRLLTQGHNTKGVDTHPHASFTPDSKGIVFTSSKFGNADVFLVEIPEWDSLPAD
jgi:oligogalacturonide lyase